jgi:hypothetical protein
MVGEHIRQILRSLARLELDPGGGCLVAVGAGNTGDLLVADVPDQQVPKAVLRLPLHRGRTRGSYELLTGQFMERLLHLAQLTATHLGQRPRPENLPEHGCILEQPLALRAQGVQPGGDQRLHRLRHLHPFGEMITVGEQAHELLSVERVASRPLQQQPLRLRWQQRPLQKRSDQARRLPI